MIWFARAGKYMIGVVGPVENCYEVPDVKRKRGKKNLTSGTLFHS